jgi:hypothetical protein
MRFDTFARPECYPRPVSGEPSPDSSPPAPRRQDDRPDASEVANRHLAPLCEATGQDRLAEVLDTALSRILYLLTTQKGDLA